MLLYQTTQNSDFSLIMNVQVRRMSQLVLKKDHAYIDTVGLGCVETHAKV
jgi:hypothetical protein